MGNTMKSRSMWIKRRVVQGSGSSELQWITFTYGKYDTMLGDRVMFPIVKVLARRIGNFALARLLLAVGVCLQVSCAWLLAHGTLVSTILPLWLMVWVVYFYVRPWERLSQRISTQSVPAEVFGLIAATAFYRCLMAVLTIAAWPLTTRDPWNVVFNVLWVLSVYSCTCIIPRKKFKSVAKAKTWFRKPLLAGVR